MNNTNTNTNIAPYTATFINSFNDAEYAKWDGVQGTIERLIANPVDEDHTNIVDPVNMPVIELKMPCGTLVQAYASDIAESEQPIELKAFLLGMNSFIINKNEDLSNEDEVSLMQIASEFMPQNLCEEQSDFFAYGFAVGSHKIN